MRAYFSCLALLLPMLPPDLPPLGSPPAVAPVQTHPKPKLKPQPGPRSPGRAVRAGVRADSLDGIPGHHFGEPRANFPELEKTGYPDTEGYMSYSLLPNQEATGWFGKNAGQVRSTYWFYQDQFASFSVFARNEGRRLLADEATFLFGPGQAQGVAFGQATYQWQGQRVRVELTDGHNETKLHVFSKPLLARQAADKLATQKAAAAARAAKFKADNAPPGQ